MALKGQSIRNGVTINVNGVKAEKQLLTIVKLLFLKQTVLS